MALAVEDAILRQNRRSGLARRLILHGVRTQIVARLTGLTRNQLATFRRRLMIRDKWRVRGPTRSPLSVFLDSPRARSEGAALASLLSRFDPPLYRESYSACASNCLDLAERLCDAYEAFRACCPQTQVQLEELIMFRNFLEKGSAVQLANCRRCKCLILIDRSEAKRECSHCSFEL